MQPATRSSESVARANVHDAPVRAHARGADEARIARLFELTSDLLATISLEGRFTMLNPAWEQVLGWTREELLARPMQELMHPDDVEQTIALMIAGGQHPAHLENFTNRYRHRDGSWRWLLWSARCDGEEWYAAARDMTDRMWLERQALHDPLTRLPNRLLLMDRTRQALARLHRSKGVVALLFIDLDRFKAVNDSFGHDVGDRLLVGVSERLAKMMRDSDTIARLGGDEFVILGEELDGESEALVLAERVLVVLKEPFAVGSGEVSMSASIGVSVGCEALVRWHPDGAERGTIDELLPATFLQRAGDSQLIVQIGDWVLHTACAQAAAWLAAGISIPISVNLAGRQLTEMDLAERVRTELKRFHLPGRALCLEVGEDTVLRDPERARAVLAEIRRMGVAIALDNFGAGKSSLSLPGRLPLDMVKLDRVLIQAFEHDRE